VWKFWEWLNEFVGEDVEVTSVNGAAPGERSPQLTR
jgi:hypothetical protein